jgi:hypothetical protein
MATGAIRGAFRSDRPPAVGWPVVAVIGIGDLLALTFWIAAGRFHLAGRRMLPFHLATMAGLHVHVYEELTRGFAPAMRETFQGAALSDATFLTAIVFAVPILYTVAAIGLWFRRPFAEFLSYTLFFGPGFMEWTHYVFPFFRPEPYGYFPGMWTAWLPMVPGFIALAWNIKRIRSERTKGVADDTARKNGDAGSPELEGRVAATERRHRGHATAHRP